MFCRMSLTRDSFSWRIDKRVDDTSVDWLSTLLSKTSFSVDASSSMLSDVMFNVVDSVNFLTFFESDNFRRFSLLSFVDVGTSKYRINLVDVSAFDV